MPDWMWFVVAIVISGGLLTLAVGADTRAQRRRSGVGQPAPRRGVEAVDRQVPSYLTQAEIDELPSPSDGTQRPTHQGEGFAFGHAHPDFATSPGGASWDNPRFLIVDAHVSAMRELLEPLGWAAPEHPLVVVAAGFDEEVLTTLAANRRALRIPVVAATAEGPDRLRLAELTGATRLDEADLRAGYFPPGALGVAEHFSSEARRCWVRPAGVAD